MNDPRPPMARPAVQFPALVLSLAVIGLGVVAVQSVLAGFELIQGPGWLQWTATQIDGLTPAGWLIGFAVAAGIVGLLLLWLGLRPRRRTHLAADSHNRVWVSRGAVAAIAEDAADRVNGVLAVESRANRRTVRVRVAADDSSALDAARAAVTQRLAGSQLESNVRLSRTKLTGGSR